MSPPPYEELIKAADSAVFLVADLREALKWAVRENCACANLLRGMLETARQLRNCCHEILTTLDLKK